MTLARGLVSINCTTCGAGLDVLGGGRVVVHICPYCGTELDASDNYRSLRRFADLERPDTPFSIGMKGRLFGVEHTIIGTLGFEERWRGRVWRWVEHQLYSPTHGYAWLTFESGHLTFSRRYRGPGWMSVLQVETAEHPPKVWSNGAAYRYYETSMSRITFAEGEFTWAPQMDETTTTVSAMSEDAMLDFSETGSERETYLSVFLDRAEVEEAFGVSLGRRPLKTHPLQPFRRGPHFDFLRKAAGGFLVLSLALAGVFHLLPGKTAVPATQIAIGEMPVDIPFEVTQANRLVRVQLRSDGQNSWAFVAAEVTGPDEEPLFEVGRTLERYAGKTSDGHWSEGTNAGSFQFFPEEIGTHYLSLDVPELQVWRDTNDWANTPRFPASSVTVSVRTGLSSGLWLLLLALGFGLVAAYHDIRRWRHNRARWAGTDWSDED